jgi:hypothetical protein
MTRFLVKFLHSFDLSASRFEILKEVAFTIQTLVKFQLYLDVIIIFLLLWTIEIHVNNEK